MKIMNIQVNKNKTRIKDVIKQLPLEEV